MAKVFGLMTKLKKKLSNLKGFFLSWFWIILENFLSQLKNRLIEKKEFKFRWMGTKISCL